MRILNESTATWQTTLDNLSFVNGESRPSLEPGGVPSGETLNPRNSPLIYDDFTVDGALMGPGDSSLGRTVLVHDFTMASVIVHWNHSIVAGVNTNISDPPPPPVVEEKQEPVKLRPRYEIL